MKKLEDNMSENQEIDVEEVVEVKVKEPKTKSYKVIAIKPTFIVVECEGDIKSLQYKNQTYSIGDIIEL